MRLMPWKPKVQRMTMTQITFVTRLAVTYENSTYEIQRYLRGDHNLVEAVAVSHYPRVFDVNSHSCSVDDRGNTCKSTGGVRFTHAFLAKVIPVAAGLRGTNIALMGSFLVNDGPTDILRQLAENPDAANALVKDCFMKLPDFANPPRGAFHYKMEDITLEQVMAMFLTVEVSETSFSFDEVPQPEFMSVYSSPDIRRQYMVS